jgi:hypothetical protein
MAPHLVPSDSSCEEVQCCSKTNYLSLLIAGQPYHRMPYYIMLELTIATFFAQNGQGMGKVWSLSDFGTEHPTFVAQAVRVTTHLLTTQTYPSGTSTH